jgi:hypothetical protein
MLIVEAYPHAIAMCLITTEKPLRQKPRNKQQQSNEKQTNTKRQDSYEIK